MPDRKPTEAAMRAARKMNSDASDEAVWFECMTIRECAEAIDSEADLHELEAVAKAARKLRRAATDEMLTVEAYDRASVECDSALSALDAKLAERERTGGESSDS